MTTAREKKDRNGVRMTRWTKTKRFFLYHYLRLMRLRKSPHEIALGLALGIFVGFLPIVPFQSVTVLILALIFRGSKIAAFAGTWISNPLNWVFFYYGLYLVGNLALPFRGVRFDPEHLEMAELIEAGWKVFGTMVVGGLILGIPGSVITYFLTKKIIVEYRKRRALRRLKKKAGL